MRKPKWQHIFDGCDLTYISPVRLQQLIDIVSRAKKADVNDDFAIRELLALSPELKAAGGYRYGAYGWPRLGVFCGGWAVQDFLEMSSTEPKGKKAVNTDEWMDIDIFAGRTLTQAQITKIEREADKWATLSELLCYTGKYGDNVFLGVKVTKDVILKRLKYIQTILPKSN